MSLRIALVQPPRKLWPFMNEQDNFLLPQGLASIAAVLRDGGFSVRVFDCMPEKLGWTALERCLRDYKPHVVAAGENHATYASEVMRLVQCAKNISPEIVTVLGGGHFTNVGELYATQYPVDFIVRGEGEFTMLELCQALASGDRDAPYEVAGISYMSEGRLKFNPPRTLIDHLDDLPIPAYDLMPMDRYGRAKYLFSSGGTTVHHSRGCPARCAFCVWWTQDAKRTIEYDSGTGCRQEILSPKWRSKSVERTMAEIELLHERYGKRCLIFTDPTFNVDPRWSAAFAEAMVAKNYELDWFAFMRADFILRDEPTGVMEALVASGLRHLCIGVERIEDSRLDNWRKSFYSQSQSAQTFDLLKTKYPQVFRQATFIVGGRTETPDSMRQQLAFARKLDPDYPAFHPLTPFPGTAVYDEAVANGWLEITDFDYFDLSTPVMRSETMTRTQIEQELIALNRNYVSLRWWLRGILSRHRYRRHMFVWWTLVMAKVFVGALFKFKNPLTGTRYTRLIKPSWYD